MKILSEPEWTRKVTCPHCRAKLEITATDIKAINTAVFYAGETFEPEVGVDCGVCHKFFEIHGVPAGLYNKAVNDLRNRIG